MTRVHQHPSLGQSCADVRLGYYRRLVGSHVVFYKKQGKNIIVVRVLHGHMDFERHL
ncbi:MAG: type II toxin-antitoxin system RelE/ParE family toxin [Alphaproteobacteria bacterium]|nr:type II toxin-antitoxin system RelE/ParE family toxin [Alphaproteobacteria bacterium]NDC57166.1 type II toxin-antitoxin system RelE/ParE family toxin [Alphaproteobacteria bacterium]NDG03967.1 type II toxin-antitoxin system RelE/ParE family toxin [Alphaproteobacteria bacterium]